MTRCRVPITTMFGQEFILRTKFMPPRSRPWTLTRPRLYVRLEQSRDYRLTLLEAPTGYGKTTTLAGWLAASQKPFIWYSLGTVEADPLVMLLHIIYAFRQRFPAAGQRALDLLQREHQQAGLTAAIHLLVNDLCDVLTGETFLALDDLHLLEGRAESLALLEELIVAAPANLHLLLASRSHPPFQHLARWQAQGEVLTLAKTDLAFLPAETEQLFRDHYGLNLTREQAGLLTTETEGWVIALQMYWQTANASPDLLPPLPGELPRNLPGLFEYLAREVLSRQPAAIQSFLLGSSILRRLRADSCAAVLHLSPSECETTLQNLSEAGLFLTPSPDHDATSYRYHHLFGEFLQNRLRQLDPDRALHLHCRAADFYTQSNRPEDALVHSLAAQDFTTAAHLLENVLADQMLSTGRLERLEEWLQHFPASLIDDRPGLLVKWGDCYRLSSRFEPALSAYHRAAARFEALADRLGRARALRGAALVYLDTVQPALAQELLEESLALVNNGEDRPLQAALLHDLGENKINRGRPLEAEGLFRQARALLNRPENPAEDARIFLRTGRLFEAVEALEQSTAAEPAGGPARAGRNHREALLLLSLINSVRGEATPAITRAEEGIKLAQDLRTPFTEAVAWQRLGHALNVAGHTPDAHRAYRQGITMGDRLHVRRLRAEGYMGLCILEGRPHGDLAAARHAAQQGLHIARQAGDEWIEGFIVLALAGALIHHGLSCYDEGRATLHTARQLLETCGDRFGRTVADLWAVLLDPQPARLASFRLECERAGYGFLLQRPTFFGPKDPALLALFDHKSELAGPHPAPAPLPARPSPSLNRLTVSALGGFVVRRPDGAELTNRDWQREKARHLFQLLLTLRHEPLPKEVILDLLWPDNDYPAADAGFKVALNALTRALEPDRASRARSTYILKLGSGSSLAYSLNLAPELVSFDAADFEQLLRQARQLETTSESAALPLYTQAIELYRGDYLPACLYDDWAAPERERLLSLFLTTTERLAQAMAARQEWERCLSLCRLILARDNCWEEAYHLSMMAHYRLGNRPAALRTYERCAATLHRELNVEPLPHTISLYKQILSD